MTIRAVAQAVGMSHNAPYKHFEDWSALLRAVAVQDFEALTKAFAEIKQRQLEPLAKLKRALRILVSYGQDYPARYRLLFSDPDLTVQGGEGDLQMAAMASFAEFVAIVQACQDAGDLPGVPNVELTCLIYASAHGLIDPQLGKRMRQERGPTDAYESVKLLVSLLRPLKGSGALS